jgi:hypothetical protein
MQRYCFFLNRKIKSRKNCIKNLISGFSCPKSRATPFNIIGNLPKAPKTPFPEDVKTFYRMAQGTSGIREKEERKAGNSSP